MRKIFEKMKAIKGSTIIIAFMYITWIAYVLFAVWVKKETNSYPPAEITYATAALFIAEAVSLARLKMAKEGTKLDQKTANPFLSKLGGIASIETFEKDAQKVSSQVSAQSSIKEVPNGRGNSNRGTSN